MAEGPGPKRPRRRPVAAIVTAALAVRLTAGPWFAVPDLGAVGLWERIGT